MSARVLSLSALAPALLFACAHRVSNLALSEPLGPEGYRPRTPSDDRSSRSKELFVCLTFSGGGTRAAALAYGVLRKLREQEIVLPDTGKRVRLLDEVDVISSVSGGSFTAAYFGLFGDRIFEDFGERMLFRNLQGELKWSLAKPWEWWRLGSSRFSRIDLAAEIYGESIFDNATFADLLARPESPALLLNATDMSTGQQFSFTQDYFDLIGSDLSRYPIANAVAASSAFPVLLTPVTLENHPAPPGFRPPRWMSKDKDLATDRPLRLAFANAVSYHASKEDRPWLHLLDGGLADNLGLDAVLLQYHHLYEHGKTQHALFIVVNAKSDPRDELSQSAAPPGIVSMIYKSGTVAMDRYSYATIDRLTTQQRSEARDLELYRGIDHELAELRAELSESAREELDAARLRRSRPPLKERITYLAEIDLERIPDPEGRQTLLELPTTFSLEPDDVKALVAAGERLLEEDPQFLDFVEALQGSPSEPDPGSTRAQ